MIKINIGTLSQNQLNNIIKRKGVAFDKVFKTVKNIIDEVKNNGLKSALEYSKLFDGLTNNNIKALELEFAEAEKNTPPKLKEALALAASNIRRFHEKQYPESYAIETMKGILCSREYRAIENVGLYIPGGTASLPSTVLMLAIPAKIAGCKRIVCFSPSKDDKISEAILYAAKLCGVDEFYKIGGAQAIALMAYGCGEIKKVDKIFGPGNSYVTAAKSLVSIDPLGCAIDMPAGPSEVMVIADKYAEPSFIAADLLSQAEHGVDSQSILVTDSETMLNEVEIEIKKQINLLTRKEFILQSLENSYFALTSSIEEAINFSNYYAPEHLILNVQDPENYKKQIQNAGSVFLGKFSPESAGDYAAGTNHSLPTYGFAKSFGSLTVESFMKPISFQKLTYDGLLGISEIIKEIAKAESLDAHFNAVNIRLKNDKKTC